MKLADSPVALTCAFSLDFAEPQSQSTAWMERTHVAAPAR